MNDLTGLTLIIGLLVSPLHLQADPLDSLRNAIKSRETEISEVDEEIKKLEVEVKYKQEEKQSLQQTVNAIAAQQKSLQQKIDSANSDISSIEQQLTEINTEIEAMEVNITNKVSGLRSNLRLIQITNDETLVEGLLKYDSLAKYWQQAEAPRKIGESIKKSMGEIRADQAQLESEKQNQIAERNRINALQEQIAVDKKSIDIARNEQEKLLGITKNEESNFQSLLEEKRQLREAFENDLASYEAQLNIALNPASIPSPATSTLSWPVANVVITQYFGNTAFAQSGAYNGSGHNGIDIDLEVGTPVMSARQGIVKGTGNTDAECPYASYGKWILIEHDNGLSTLYAHLSSINVSSGQSIGRSEVIGYGGNSGYSTGSHLHFSVYATEGVRVGGLPSRSCPGTSLTLPLADLSAYLNPIQYLP